MRDFTVHYSNLHDELERIKNDSSVSNVRLQNDTINHVPIVILRYLQLVRTGFHSSMPQYFKDDHTIICIPD